MTGPDQKLCDRCHERPATCHICFGHTGETKDLCETCYGESAPPEELASAQQIQQIIRNGKCRYCGEPAVGGGGPLVSDFLANLMANLLPSMAVVTSRPGYPFHLWCEQCRKDLVEFAHRPENAIPDWPFDDEAAQRLVTEQLADRERRQEEFMKQRVLERKSKR